MIKITELPYDINDLRKLCEENKVKWFMHAVKRMRMRRISSGDFKNAIYTGEIIEKYPQDTPLPSCLVSGYSLEQSHLHAVTGCDNEFLYAVTAYYPDSDYWENDFKTRKER